MVNPTDRIVLQMSLSVMEARELLSDIVEESCVFYSAQRVDNEQELRLTFDGYLAVCLSDFRFIEVPESIYEIMRGVGASLRTVRTELYKVLTPSALGYVITSWIRDVCGDFKLLDMDDEQGWVGSVPPDKLKVQAVQVFKNNGFDLKFDYEGCPWKLTWTKYPMNYCSAAELHELGEQIAVQLAEPYPDYGVEDEDDEEDDGSEDYLT